MGRTSSWTHLVCSDVCLYRWDWGFCSCILLFSLLPTPSTLCFDITFLLFEPDALRHPRNTSLLTSRLSDLSLSPWSLKRVDSPPSSILDILLAPFLCTSIRTLSSQSHHVSGKSRSGKRCSGRDCRTCRDRLVHSMHQNITAWPKRGWVGSTLQDELHSCRHFRVVNDVTMSTTIPFSSSMKVSGATIFELQALLDWMCSFGSTSDPKTDKTTMPGCLMIWRNI